MQSGRLEQFKRYVRAAYKSYEIWVGGVGSVLFLALAIVAGINGQGAWVQIVLILIAVLAAFYGGFGVLSVWTTSWPLIFRTIQNRC